MMEEAKEYLPKKKPIEKDKRRNKARPKSTKVSIKLRDSLLTDKLMKPIDSYSKEWPEQLKITSLLKIALSCYPHISYWLKPTFAMEEVDWRKLKNSWLLPTGICLNSLPKKTRKAVVDLMILSLPRKKSSNTKLVFTKLSVDYSYLKLDLKPNRKLEKSFLKVYS